MRTASLKRVRLIRWMSIFLFCTGLCFHSNIHGNETEPAHFPSLISSLKIKIPQSFCGESVPMEIPDVKERFEKELLLSLWDRAQVVLWLKRSRRYFPQIEEMLRENGLPDDLKYIAVAESALRPHIGSDKGALGFWQFVTHTGRKYGLTINERIDERRNLAKSTMAAIRYFKELYKEFGAWTLAVAAFNMGEEGLMAEILAQQTNNYYQLYLPLETQRFLFRIFSAKLIFSEPVTYGFRLSEEDYYPPKAFDTVQVTCPSDVPILIVAQAAKTSFKEIKDLNPQFRGYYLPSGTHEIHVPKSSSSGFQKRYRPLVEKFLSAREERIYVVKKGDSLSIIADKFNVPLAALIIWNRIDPRRPIHPGDRLVISPRTIKIE
jgi:membrane-bound lytic murein transglycosylase D